MVETLEINNPAILIFPEQADSTFGKNVIIGEPRESKKGKKDLDREVVLEKSKDNQESLKITIKSSGLGGQAQTPMDKQKSATNTIVQRGSIRPTLKVGQTDFNVGGQKKSARLISQIGQVNCKQKLKDTYKDGVLIPNPLIHQNPHRWRMCADVTHNEQRCFTHSRLSYGQSSSNKEQPIKLVLHKLTNQVQRKGKASAKQVYVLRDKNVFINPTRKADEQIVIKIGPVGALMKESEGPIVIDNLNQSNVEKISKGADINNHEAWISTSALENFQPTWCPSGLSRMQKCKL
jgi:hypothetical protein